MINETRDWTVELLIGTRESKDPRVQAGLASPSTAFKGLASSDCEQI